MNNFYYYFFYLMARTSKTMGAISSVQGIRSIGFISFIEGINIWAILIFLEYKDIIAIKSITSLLIMFGAYLLLLCVNYVLLVYHGKDEKIIKYYQDIETRPSNEYKFIFVCCYIIFSFFLLMYFGTLYRQKHGI